VLERQLAEGSNHVLNRRVLPVAVLATEGVEPWNLVEEIVDDSDDNGNTNGVSPDDNDGDNVDPSVITEPAVDRRGVRLVRLARHPSEDGEDSGQSVDTENGNDELERGEGLATTGNEDQPVLGKRNLKEKDGLDSTEVLDDTTVVEEESATDDPGTESEQKTEDD
jgi:hypothetical protein